MSSLKKIKYSFVLCLALLFSFSLAGTIYVNNNSYSAVYLDQNYSVSISDDNYLIFYYNDINHDGTFYSVYNIQDFRTCTKFGVYHSTQNNTYQLFALNEDNSPTSYLFTQQLRLPTDHLFGSIEYQGSSSPVTLTSSDFPYTFPSNDFRSYTYPLFASANNVNFDFVYSPLNVYEITSFTSGVANLGDLVYNSVGSIPAFTNPFTQQEVNTYVNNLFSSPSLVNNLPSNYTNFFLIYNTTSEYFTAVFYPSDYSPRGRLILYNDDSFDVNYYNFIFQNDRITLISLIGTRDIYYFDSPDGINFDLLYTQNIDSPDLLKAYYDYYEQPVIYSTKNFPFDYYIDNINSGFGFSLSSFDIVDSNNQVITASDVLSASKDNNSIWTIIHNIFNPPTSTTNINSIEQQHNDIISKADNNAFFNNFENSKSLIVSLTSITWLTTAVSMMFSIFKDFIILCCVFLTISRVMG